MGRLPAREVDMKDGTAKAIFWVGTVASLGLFLVLTLDTHGKIAALSHADQLNARVVAGKRAFERYNCNDCHTILGFGGYYAPDLTRAWLRLGNEAVRRRLEHPDAVFAESFRKMPQQNLQPAEVDALLGFLAWVGNIENGHWPPQDDARRWRRSTERLLAGASMSPGAALVMQENCLECHQVGDRGESIGPRFEWIGARRDASWISTYLTDPQAQSPGSSMPEYAHLDASQKQAIAEFVASLGSEGRR
jgi:nitric oxide reductase subunit C